MASNDPLLGCDADRIFSLKFCFKLPDLYGQRRCTIFGIAERAGEQLRMPLLVLGALRLDGRHQSMKRLLERSAHSLYGCEHYGADLAARHCSGRRSRQRLGSPLITPFTHERLHVATGRADLLADLADIRVLATRDEAVDYGANPRAKANLIGGKRVGGRGHDGLSSLPTVGPRRILLRTRARLQHECHFSHFFGFGRLKAQSGNVTGVTNVTRTNWGWLSRAGLERLLGGRNGGASGQRVVDGGESIRGWYVDVVLRSSRGLQMTT